MASCLRSFHLRICCWPLPGAGYWPKWTFDLTWQDCLHLLHCAGNRYRQKQLPETLLWGGFKPPCGLLRSLTVATDRLPLHWETYLISFMERHQLRLCCHPTKLWCNKYKLPSQFYKLLGQKKNSQGRERITEKQNLHSSQAVLWRLCSRQG